MFVVGCGALAVFAVAALRWNVVKVRLANHAGRRITDVRIAGRCFERSLSELDAGDSVTYWVRPCGESGVDVAFRSEAKNVSQKNLGYIESAGAYSLDLLIASDLAVELGR